MSYTPLLSRMLNKVPVPYTGRGYGGPFSSISGRNDAVAQMSAMASNSTLFAIVGNLANATASVNWHMHRLNGREACPVCDKPGVTLIDTHPALVVWNKPNNFYTRQEFVETFQQHIELTGEGWWVVDYIGNMPIELWPIRPDRITPVPHPTNFLSGYVYHGPDGEKIPLELTEVVQIRLPNPMDPYRGAGPVQSLLMHLDTVRYSTEWNRNFFINQAAPGGIIEVPKTLTDEEFNRLQKQWNEQHKGISRAHSVAILEQGQWKDRSITQKDMQFTELSTLSREIILEAYGYPKSMLGTVTDVNRANAEAMEYVLAKWRIVPRLERIKMAANNDFLPLFGETGKGVEFDYESPVPEDSEKKNIERDSTVKAVVALVDAGFDPSEACLAMGIEPIKHNGMVGVGSNG